MVRQVGNVSRASRANSRFDRRVWLLASPDTVEEILHVRNRALTKTLSLQNGILLGRNALMMDAESLAVKLERRLRAAKFQSAVVNRRRHHALVHYIESGIADRGLNRIRTVPLLEHVFIAKHQRVLRRVRLHRPMRHVNPVREEIGHRPATKIPKPAPVIELFFRERLIGSAAEPLLPVER